MSECTYREPILREGEQSRDIEVVGANKDAIDTIVARAHIMGLCVTSPLALADGRFTGTINVRKE